MIKFYPAFSGVFTDFFGLFFPKLCLACEGVLPAGEAHICLSCQLELPKTALHLTANNIFTERLAGRVRLHRGTAMFEFRAESRVASLIHAIKYENKPDAAVEIGRWYGENLKKTGDFDDVTAILPVPMFRKKEVMRGFNQSERFAEGLSETMGLRVDENILKKVRMTESQTKKNRTERLKNTEEVFTVATKIKENPTPHFLIVDDVLTTGATLESCATALLKATPHLKISMATIAIRV
ncbi:MAG: hypothetical protein RL757_1374 [Bacteroidota bacterium]|jgi:ComF family protein